jgi:hypothetical protein
MHPTRKYRKNSLFYLLLALIYLQVRKKNVLITLDGVLYNLHCVDKITKEYKELKKEFSSHDTFLSLFLLDRTHFLSTLRKKRKNYALYDNIKLNMIM